MAVAMVTTVWTHKSDRQTSDNESLRLVVTRLWNKWRILSGIINARREAAHTRVRGAAAASAIRQTYVSILIFTGVDHN